MNEDRTLDILSSSLSGIIQRTMMPNSRTFICATTISLHRTGKNAREPSDHVPTLLTAELNTNRWMDAAAAATTAGR